MGKASDLPDEMQEVISEIIYLHAEVETLRHAIAQLQVDHYAIAELLLIALGGLSPEEAHSLVSEVFEAKRNQ